MVHVPQKSDPILRALESKKLGECYLVELRLKKEHDHPLQVSNFVTLKSHFVRLMDRINVNW